MLCVRAGGPALPAKTCSFLFADGSAHIASYELRAAGPLRPESRCAIQSGLVPRRRHGWRLLIPGSATCLLDLPGSPADLEARQAGNSGAGRGRRGPRGPCEFYQRLHVTDQFFFRPYAFPPFSFILFKLFHKPLPAPWSQAQRSWKNPVSIYRAMA